MLIIYRVFCVLCWLPLMLPMVWFQRPLALMRANIDHEGVYCLGIRNTGSGGMLIIGDTTMEDYLVVFDREQNRIGWAPVNTKTCGSL
jgi:hypothetical protein